MVGFRKPRKIRPKEKDLPKGYDSKWEHTLHETVLQDWEHHWELIPYIVKHKYEPDFVKEIDGITILIEAKGRFWDYPEYSKYIHIRTALPENTELVFLFQKPFAPMPGAKMRKDRTKRTHAEWAETNNFTWYSEDTLPLDWGNYEL
tara:strand:+ start:5779 stop:6219 length:441 start_codon:yes stop_codon:yes gene_type:complete